MFCYQCEQTTQGTGCTIQGVCGKDPRTAALLDLLMHSMKGLSMYAHRLRQLGMKDHEIDVFTLEGLFSTVTNVNFDPERIKTLLKKLVKLRERAQSLYSEECRNEGKEPEVLEGPATLCPPSWDLEVLEMVGKEVTIEKRLKEKGPDITGLQELLTYGLKGMAAYAYHAQILGQEDDSVFGFIHEAMNFLTAENPSSDELLGYSMRCGEMNLKVMELLDRANTGAYGHPVPTKVRIEPLKGKAILVSGHDLKDLEELLKQTEGKGINIYTHGEMLPAHGYPGLKKYPHLVGNYGGAWQDQKEEFDKFPGAILITTNCIQKPRESYIGRIFTCGLVAWPGVIHIKNRDFSPVINAALATEGFKEDGPERTILVGFGHNSLMGSAEAVVNAVKKGAIKHFFLIGGCDGAKPGRNYYAQFAESVPKDSIILTLACGKYRFNKRDYSDIGGIPRLIDIGQCNDAYSAIQLAVALAKVFNCGVNDLPLSLILSWYEQKAVVILLSLLHLGIRNIRLGPSLPAFVTPAILNVLVQKFNIMPVSTAEDDLKAILGEKVS